MAIPHYNFFPPAGQVVDASDSHNTWDGRSWRRKGKVYTMPSSHRLIGKAGTSYAGWYYDWQKKAWMQPSAATAQPAAPAAPARPPTRPAPPHPAPSHPAPPAQPQPKPQPPARAPEKKEDMHMEKKPGSMIDSLVKHPVAPVIGGLLLLASNLTDEPQPPQITSDVPDATAKQWQMIYNQNQQRFDRRMALYEQLAMVLLGYSSAQTMLDGLPAKRAA